MTTRSSPLITCSSSALQSRLVRAAPWVGFAVVSLLGCGVRVKQDTPEQAVQTLLAMYDKGDFRRVSRVVDRDFTAIQERLRACDDLVKLRIKCRAEVTLAARDYGGVGPEDGRRTSPECVDPVKLDACACGEKGNKAAAAARPYLESREHQALLRVKFGSGNCKIESSEEAGSKSARFMSNVADALCDVFTEERYTLVNVVCGEQTKIGLVMRNRKDAWQFLAFEPLTQNRLVGAAEPKPAQKP